MWIEMPNTNSIPLLPSNGVFTIQMPVMVIIIKDIAKISEI